MLCTDGCILMMRVIVYSMNDCVCAVRLCKKLYCLSLQKHTHTQTEPKDSNMNFVFIYGFISYTITENRGTPTCLNLTSQREKEDVYHG